MPPRGPGRDATADAGSVSDRDWPEWRPALGRGQSGTLGVLLLVALVLVLVGTVGLYLFSDLSGEDDEPIVVSIDSGVESGAVVVSHDGGDTLDPDAVSVVLEGADRSVQTRLGESTAASGRFSAGDAWSVDAGGSLAGEVRVVVVHEPTNTVLHEGAHSVAAGNQTPTTLSALEIADQGENATVVRGANASVSVTVTNAGETPTRADVTVAVGSGVSRTETTAELEPGADERVTVENLTGTLSADSYGVTVSTATDEITGSLTVEPPAQGALAYGTAAQTVVVHNTSNWNQTATLDDADGDVLTLAWSPDGTRLAFGGVDGRVYVLNRSDWSHVATLTAADDVVSAVAWSPDGAHLAYGSHDGTVTVHETASWAVERTLSGPGASVWDVAFGPDGAALAAGTTTGVAIHETDGWTQTTTLTGPGFTDSLAWSPDGGRLAVGNVTGGVTVLETAGWTAERDFGLTDRNRIVRSLAWNPEGGSLATAWDDGLVSVHNTTTWNRTLVTGADPAVWSVAWSADGSKFAFGSEDGTVTVAEERELGPVLYLGRDGRVAGSATGNETETWLPEETLDAGAPVRSVAFVGGATE